MAPYRPELGGDGAGPGFFAGFPSSLNGIDIGVPVWAIPLAQGLELGIEGVWTKFNSESIGSGPDAVTLDPQQLSVMGRLSLRFGD